MTELTKEEMIKVIYEEIAEQYEIYQWPDNPPVIDFKLVMIWDVLDWIEKWNFFDKIVILQLWKEKRKPIEKQSEECIEYFYNLIKE
jgi:hypothetical protein